MGVGPTDQLAYPVSPHRGTAELGGAERAVTKANGSRHLSLIGPACGCHRGALPGRGVSRRRRRSWAKTRALFGRLSRWTSAPYSRPSRRPCTRRLSPSRVAKAVAARRQMCAAVAPRAGLRRGLRQRCLAPPPSTSARRRGARTRRRAAIRRPRPVPLTFLSALATFPPRLRWSRTAPPFLGAGGSAAAVAAAPAAVRPAPRPWRLAARFGSRIVTKSWPAPARRRPSTRTRRRTTRRPCCPSNTRFRLR